MPLSAWNGVELDANGVKKLQLRENGLSGPIPPELGNLTNLFDLVSLQKSAKRDNTVLVGGS